MIKKLIYGGLVSVVLAIIVLIILSGQESGIIQGYAQNSTTYNLTIASHGFGSEEIYINQTSYILTTATSSGRANVYFMNGTAFSMWSAYSKLRNSSMTGLDYAASLEGDGALVIYKNTTIASIPFLSQLSQSGVQETKPIYSINTSKPYAQGAYYIVIDNTNGSASANGAIAANIVVPTPLSNSTIAYFNKAQLSLLPYGTVFFVLLVAGIILIVYGYFKKPREPQPPAGAGGKTHTEHTTEKGLPSDADINVLYRNIEKRKRAKKGANT